METELRQIIRAVAQRTGFTGLSAVRWSSELATYQAPEVSRLTVW
jgi:hypothetical protein